MLFRTGSQAILILLAAFFACSDLQAMDGVPVAVHVAHGDELTLETYAGEHAKFSCRSRTEISNSDREAIKVTSIPADGPAEALRVQVDGVQIVIVSADRIADASKGLNLADHSIDLIVVSLAQYASLNNQGLLDVVKSTDADRVLLLPHTTLPPKQVEQFATNLSLEPKDIKRVSHQTLGNRSRPGVMN